MTEERNLWQEDQASLDLKFYIKQAKKPLVVGLAVILFFYLISLISFLSWPESVLNYFSWLVAVLALLVICFRVARAKSDDLSHAATAGFLVGVIFGVWHVIWRSLWFWSWWAIINLITETLFLALAGLFMGLITAKIFKIIKNKKDKSVAVQDRFNARLKSNPAATEIELTEESEQ